MITIGAQVTAPLWGATGTVMAISNGRYLVEIPGLDEWRGFKPEQLQAI